MKKILFVIILAVIIAGSASADYSEDKFGVGIMGGWYGDWEGWGWGHSVLSLKIPGIPVFWGIHMGFRSGFFHLGVSGDYYLFHEPLVSAINLNWYLGIGGWLNVGFNPGYFSFGARLPIGLSWHLLEIVNKIGLELFAEFAPSLGIMVAPDFHFPSGGWPIALGVRLWF